MHETSVSICTISMNRLHHVQKTLPANLHENEHPGVNFILLDYNSKDGLGDYVRENFQEEIKAGKLVYYRYHDAESFDRCHSRNMAFKLAEGEILCNVDADNYAGEGFGEFVKNMFSEKKNVCLTGLENEYKHDASGKLCVSRKDFMDVTGYDEHFDGYGFEDFDIVNRLGLKGCDTLTINIPGYLQAITHERNDRMNNESFYQGLKAVYVRYIDPSISELLYQFTDLTCVKGIVLNCFTKNCDSPESTVPRNSKFLPQFELPNDWLPGTWCDRGDQLQLSFNGSTEYLYHNVQLSQEIFQNELHSYYLVANHEMKLEAASFFTEMKNRGLMLSNLSSKKIRVNNSFGKGVVYKNFNEQEPIEI